MGSYDKDYFNLHRISGLPKLVGNTRKQSRFNLANILHGNFKLLQQGYNNFCIEKPLIDNYFELIVAKDLEVTYTRSNKRLDELQQIGKKTLLVFFDDDAAVTIL